MALSSFQKALLAKYWKSRIAQLTTIIVNCIELDFFKAFKFRCYLKGDYAHVSTTYLLQLVAIATILQGNIITGGANNIVSSIT
jgi:hypothetical protein